MMNETIVTVTARYDESKKSQFTADILQLALAQRLWLGLKALLICWIVAGVAVAIPVLHFILVPSGIIIGIVMFFLQLGLREKMAAATFACPSCQKEVQVKAGAIAWPKQVMCSHCGTELVLTSQGAQ